MNISAQLASHLPASVKSFFDNVIASKPQWLSDTIGAHEVLVSRVAIGLASVLVVRLYYNHKHSYFERRGIKTPSGKLPVLGHVFQFATKPRKDIDEQWFAECGSLYGVYLGSYPWLVVADADVLRQIAIKDFHIFPNHETSSLLTSYQKSFVIFSQDEHWKKLRSMQSPTFTSGKIKRMFRLLDACADDLVECFREKVGTEDEVAVQINDLYHLYTMDGIATCAYGLKLMRNKGDDMKSMAARNEFISAGLRLFDNSPVRIALWRLLPESVLSVFGFTIVPRNSLEPLARQSRQVIKARRASSKRHDDYLQLLLDAKFKDELELNEMDAKENHHASLTRESILDDQSRLIDEVERNTQHTDQQLKLNEFEILASTMLLLAVGLETTATNLTLTTYALAFHPNVQQTLHDEVAPIAQWDATKSIHMFDYDKLTSCAYLDAVISESLRLLSPVVAFDRIPKQDYTIEKYNLKLDKSTRIFLSFYGIMHNPEYWPEPYKFDPDRFMPHNKDKIVPGSYCPFGIGPRHCLGMRFSLTETKIALAKLIMNFRFKPAPDTEFPPASKNHFTLYNAKRPYVYVAVRK